MARCFVIQPFDGGRYDKRYEDVFVPAIDAAGLEPYRVDHDPSVSIPIDEIEKGIAASAICLAEISTDNPNVWFELGYAIAKERDVVLMCSEDRASKYPFDIQHRTVIKYATESVSDFEALKEKITARLLAAISKREKMGDIGKLNAVSSSDGLEPHEVAALVAVAQEIAGPNIGVSHFMIRQDMENAGFTKIASTLAVRSLEHKGLLSSSEDQEFNGEWYTAYQLTDQAVAWLHENQDTLKLRKEASIKEFIL